MRKCRIGTAKFFTLLLLLYHTSVKSKGLKLRKGPKTWCKGNERTRFCGSLCTKPKGLELRKGPKTWCKRNEGTRFCGDSCTKSEAAERRTTETRRRKSSDRHASGPDSLFFRNERSRCTKCTAASSIYYAFLGLQVQRRSPRRPAAPRPRGEARTACTSRAYIGRLGMRTVKVVPLPGMLST